jgi:hypothetical protein
MHARSSSRCCGLAILVSLLVLSGCEEDVARRSRPGRREQSSEQTHAVKPDPHAPRFREFAALAGVDFIYHNGSETNQSTILESVGGGVAMLDYDGDQLLDLCFPGGGRITEQIETQPLPNGLFRNLGEGKFANVTAAAGIERAEHYSHGAAVGDFDGDGFADILITGYGGLQLWHNQGDGTFREIHSAAGLLDSRWSTSAGWGDFNGDGDLDLYVAHYVNWSAENNP